MSTFYPIFSQEPYQCSQLSWTILKVYYMSLSVLLQVSFTVLRLDTKWLCCNELMDWATMLLSSSALYQFKMQIHMSSRFNNLNFFRVLNLWQLLIQCNIQRYHWPGFAFSLILFQGYHWHQQLVSVLYSFQIKTCYRHLQLFSDLDLLVLN